MINNSQLIVRKATENDIDRIIEIHKRSMPEALLVRLGSSFLKKRVYSFAIKSPDVQIFVLENYEKVFGACIFSRTAKTFSQELSKYKVDIFFSAIRQVYTYPALLWDCLTTNNQNDTDWKNCAPDNFFYLFLIAIEPGTQRFGYGSYLLNHGLEESSKYFQINNCLVDARRSDSYNFYTKNQFVEIGQEMRGTKQFFKLLKNTKTT